MDGDSSMRRPLFLVSNDDGYRARGVHELTKMLSRLGDVIAVCPEEAQSAMSMALTIKRPLRLRRLHDYAESEPGVEWYAVDGTPVDCVKLAMYAVLGERRPDMVCAGINHGSNSAINVIYSGTMGAAFEGTACGIPSVGFSLCDHSEDADFTPMMPFVEETVKKILAEGLPKGVCLNLNAPLSKELKGIRYCRAAEGHWTDEYEPMQPPFGSTVYWLTGRFVTDEPDAEDTDEWALSHGYISIVPELLDRTARDFKA
ncbi:MAG: 5'/3'-nucleotidase SurE [Muribaculaceae bacterium]|nr:5'/3'-nucleotidase SurE [Muribaculaceae bacterium]